MIENLKKLQIGKDVLSTPGKKKPKLLAYFDCCPDLDGWIDFSKYCPIPFDLLWLKTDKKIYYGWWNGKDFESRKMSRKQTVFYFKHRREVFN